MSSNNPGVSVVQAVVLLHRPHRSPDIGVQPITERIVFECGGLFLEQFS